MNLALDRAGIKFPLLEAANSAAIVIDMIDNYGLDMTGTFRSHDDEEYPW